MIKARSWASQAATQWLASFQASSLVTATGSSPSKFKQFAHALNLRAANGNFGVLFVVHFQHEGGIEPRHNFLDVMNIHQERAVRLPEGFGIEGIAQLFEGPVIRTAFDIASHDGNRAAVNGSPDQILAVHQEQFLL